MTKKINQGESTEFKCEPEEVAREMKIDKMKMVNEFLYYGDFLAASQIASFLVDFR